MNHRSARVEEMIVVEVTEGAGVEGDPVRVVSYYHSKDGALRAMFDPHRESDQQGLLKGNWLYQA